MRYSTSSFVDLKIEKVPQAFLIELLLSHFEGSPKLGLLLPLADICDPNNIITDMLHNIHNDN